MHSLPGDLPRVSKGGSDGAVRCLKEIDFGFLHICFRLWPEGNNGKGAGRFVYIILPVSRGKVLKTIALLLHFS